MSRRIVMIALTIVVLGAAPPAAAQMSQDEAMQLARQYQAQDAGAAERPPVPIALTEKDVTGLLAAMEELQRLGIDSRIEADDSGRIAMSDALAANEEALAILQRHGFAPERFKRVVYSVGYAVAAIQMKGQEAEMDRALAAQEQALEQMKGQLTPEQLNMIRSQAGMAKASMQRVEEQPAGNVELVEKHIEELLRVVEGERRPR